MPSYPQRTTSPPDSPSFGERYEILKKLGSGGMGAVYQAVDSALEKTVAVKILLPGLASETIIRFQQEAKAAGRLDHPNIVKVLDFGQTPNGDLFLIMDYVGRTSLDDMIEKEKRLSIDKALPIFIQIAAGLQHAHKNGILHRDVKPSNVMLSEKQEGNVQIVDFGLAKLQSTNDKQKLTTTGMRVGSPLFMSPEQADGIECDTRSDIYSLGCLMYKALTGQPPLQGDTFMDTILMQRDTVPLLLNDTDCGVEFPAEIEELVAKALEKDPDNRFQSAEELKRTLEGLQELFKARLALTASFGQGVHDPHHLEQKTSLTVWIARVLDSVCAAVFVHRKAILICAIFFVSAVSFSLFHFSGMFHDRKDFKMTTASPTPEFMNKATAAVIDSDLSMPGKKHKDNFVKKKTWDRIPEYSSKSAKEMIEEMDSTPSMRKYAEDSQTRAAIASGKLHRLWHNHEMGGLFHGDAIQELAPQLTGLWNDPTMADVWSDPIVQEWVRKPDLWSSWRAKSMSPVLSKYVKNKNVQTIMRDPRFEALIADVRFQKLARDKRFQKLLEEPVNLKLMRCMEAYRDQMRFDVADIMCPIQNDLSHSDPSGGG